MAAEPIHGCSTTPMGMKTPGRGEDDTQGVAQGRQPGGPSLTAHLMLSSSGQLRSLLLGAGHGPVELRQADSELGGGGTIEGTESPTCPDLPGTIGGITGLGEAPGDRAPQGPFGTAIPGPLGGVSIGIRCQ